MYSGSLHPDSTLVCKIIYSCSMPLKHISVMYLPNRYQTLAVATDANTKEDIGNKKVSGKKLTVIIRRIGCIMYQYLFIGLWVMLLYISISSLE